MSLKESAPVAPDPADSASGPADDPSGPADTPSGPVGGAKAGHPHRATSWPEARAVAGRAGAAARTGREPLALPLGRALGQVLAGPLPALADLPSFDTSAMDGWAVAGPGPWHVREETAVLAGHAPAAALAGGEAVRIATGAPVPPGTTAVLRTEHSRTEQPRTEQPRTEHSRPERPDGPPRALLHALREVVAGQDIRPRGQECRSGDELLPAGAAVTPAVLGLAAAAGYDELLVRPRPRVEILVLGDELLAAGLPHEGLIRDALGPMLGPWLAALGADVLATRRIGDDAEALYAAVTGSAADLVVTTGGTAAGPVDHVHRVLDKAGATLLVDGVKVRPGHPMLLARLGTDPARPLHVRHLVGLPGNPLAAVSGLLTLAAPLLAALARAASPASPAFPAEDGAGSGARTPVPYRVPVRDEVHGHPHDTRLVPVVRRGGSAVPLRYNGPAMLRGVAAADGLAVVPPGGARPGQELDVLDLPWPPTAGAAPAQGACFT
ncbi:MULTISPECIES: molybdopterin molybdotransferase MoeA [unclassified Streptomyces]|uniref:molybdopterin molybdotransferase MoeA n=1 Tax=unclassified Streptomyces TaxID=2593676 RepID=UPI0006AFBB04|nr:MULTISPECIES: molybdopterin-binding protein [unclassified Streptomyces]KOX38491.1 molybdenum cofactor biosynthesis protein MoeA [Streptomyces sp. NRRL F-6491]KOX52685.1 molybdenum cofactor biosynthesis protein MoeA [Streptomyces sp. NRRL F-6492]